MTAERGRLFDGPAERYRPCRPRQLLLLIAGLLQSPMCQCWRRARQWHRSHQRLQRRKCETWDLFRSAPTGSGAHWPGIMYDLRLVFLYPR
jgi:hypothetical protein